MEFLLDTSALNSYLKFPKAIRDGKEARVAELRPAFEKIDALPTLHFSAITVWEIERWLIMKEARQQLVSFHRLCQLSAVLPVDNSVLSAASEIWSTLRRAGENPGDMDVLILATAAIWGYPLVTADASLRRSASRLEEPVPTFDWSKP